MLSSERCDTSLGDLILIKLRDTGLILSRINIARLCVVYMVFDLKPNIYQLDLNPMKVVGATPTLATNVCSLIKL